MKEVPSVSAVNNLHGTPMAHVSLAIRTAQVAISLTIQNSAKHASILMQMSMIALRVVTASKYRMDPYARQYAQSLSSSQRMKDACVLKEKRVAHPESVKPAM